MSISMPPPHEVLTDEPPATMNNVWYRWLEENVGSGGSGGSQAHANGILTPHENLVIYWASNSTLTVTADAVLLFNSAGSGSRFTSLSATTNIATSGADGLDTGAEASSTWYYVHAIGGTTLATLLSTSATSPTLPSGYTYSGLIGAVYNDGSSNFIRMLQRGRWVNRAALTILSVGTATSYTSLSLAAGIPSQASAGLFEFQVVPSAGTNVDSLVVAPEGSATTETYGGRRRVSGNIDPNGVITSASCGQNNSNAIYYYVAGTNATANIYLTGWRW